MPSVGQQWLREPMREADSVGQGYSRILKSNADIRGRKNDTQATERNPGVSQLTMIQTTESWSFVGDSLWHGTGAVFGPLQMVGLSFSRTGKSFHSASLQISFNFPTRMTKYILNPRF